MDARRWERIQEIFDLVVDLPASEREVKLAEEVGDDAELLAEIQALLESDESDLSILKQPAAASLHILNEESSEGRRVGQYRLIRRIGYGGMGEVYLAERTDDQFHQKVAVKIIRPGMNNDEILRRFHDERQILARLSHPHIGALYDGGMTDDGRPYFSMEFIEGEPIDRYCDSHNLTITERLRLFADVLSAVAYAQRNFVVHRDLKPGNIIVTTDGVVKLLDFGIAKLIESEDLDIKSQQTQTVYRMMTPGYASPEQVKGQPITTASDVYSLGVILYELLSGHRPYDTSNRTPAELESLICTTDPSKPSTAAVSTDRTKTAINTEGVKAIAANRQTAPERLKKILAGDLDNICMKAMDKDQDRRYSAADQLAEDIDRYLRGHPVLARPATVMYRVHKFVNRHKVGVLSSLVAIFLIVSLVTFYTVQLSRERDKAQLESAKAKQVASYITSIFEIANPSASKGETITARELLDEGAERLEEELADQPVIQAEMLSVLGGVYYSLGLLEKSKELYERELGLLLEHAPKNSLELSNAYHDLGDINYDLGAYLVADTMYRTALDIKQAVLDKNDTLIALGYISLATVARLNGNFEESQELYENALSIQHVSLTKPHSDIAYTMNNLGRLYQNQELYDKAEPLLKESLSMRLELYGELNFETIASMGSLASFYSATDRNSESRDLYQKAVSNLSTMVGEDHHYIGGLTHSLANIEYKLENYGEAERLFRKSYDVLLKQLPKDHVQIALPLFGIGKVYLETGKHEQALAQFQEAYRIRKLSFSPDNYQLATAEFFLGRAYVKLEQFEKAEKSLGKAYTVFDAKFGTEHYRTQQVIESLVELYSVSQNPEKHTFYNNKLISQ